MVFTKLPKLPILPSIPIIPITPITPITPIRSTANRVVPVISPEAQPRDTSPAEAGAWGWVRLGIACASRQVSRG